MAQKGAVSPRMMIFTLQMIKGWSYIQIYECTQFSGISYERVTYFVFTDFMAHSLAQHTAFLESIQLGAGLPHPISYPFFSSCR
jgi:hypothetical protein